MLIKGCCHIRCVATYSALEVANSQVVDSWIVRFETHF